MDNLKNYINWLKDRNRSLSTINIYTQHLRQFNQPITTDSIRNFLKQNLTKYQPNTLKTIRQSLSSYAKFAQIEIDWARINGIIPKMARKFFSTLNQMELKQLKNTRYEKSLATYQRNNLILDFLFYSGLRVSELVNIRHSDWQGKSLRVHGKGNKVRQVFFPPFLVKYFKPTSSNYLFTKLKGSNSLMPLSSLVIRQIIQQRIKKAGWDKPITPHSFRRSFATLLHNKGTYLTTIQQLLGHDSIQTTEKYIHNDYDTLYQDYSKLWKEPINSYAH